MVVTSVENTIKCFKRWQAAQRRKKKSESVITMCDRMQMYNIMFCKMLARNVLCALGIGIL
jgi:hypothetical protein